MNYERASELVRTTDGQLQILQELMPVFKQLDDYTNKLMNGLFVNPEHIEKLLTKSNGYWNYLSSIADAVNTFKEHEEGRLFEKMRMDTEKSSETKGKFNVSSVKETISHEVNPIRAVRNRVLAYASMADKNIICCQSFLKNHNDRLNRNNYQAG